MAWIVGLTHYLDSDGRIAANLPAAVWRHARYFGAINVAATEEPEDEDAGNPVRCRRRPGRKPCPGVIQDTWLEPIDSAGKPKEEFNLENLAIGWRRPVCGDQGVISGWVDSPWDCMPEGIIMTDCSEI